MAAPIDKLTQDKLDVLNRTVCAIDPWQGENTMPRIDEHLDVGTYLKQTMRTVDGLAWFAVSIASIFCLMDILLGTNIIPLREVARPSKAITLLLFSPLVIFSILVRLRQLPMSGYHSSWIRAILCVFVFLYINFWRGAFLVFLNKRVKKWTMKNLSLLALWNKIVKKI